MAIKKDWPWEEGIWKGKGRGAMGKLSLYLCKSVELCDPDNLVRGCKKFYFVQSILHALCNGLCTSTNELHYPKGFFLSFFELSACLVPSRD